MSAPCREGVGLARETAEYTKIFFVRFMFARISFYINIDGIYNHWLS